MEEIKNNELEIFNIKVDSERITVSARGLYDFLEVKTEFRKWFPRMTEYGFNKDVDYRRVSRKCPTLGGLQEMVDYEITLDMAKELAMIQRTERGKEARQYFIKIEKIWNSPEQIMARAVLESKKMIDNLNNQLIEQKPLVDFANHVSNTSDLIDVGKMAKLLKEENINIGRNRLFEYLRKEKILMKNNLPYQKYIDLGYFKVKESVSKTAYGSKVYTTTYVTGKGQIYITEKIRSELY